MNLELILIQLFSISVQKWHCILASEFNNLITLPRYMRKTILFVIIQIMIPILFGFTFVAEIVAVLLFLLTT